MVKNVIFNNISFKNIKNINIKYLLHKKGLFVFPSGPGLSSINLNQKYFDALKNSDHVFFDSGYFVILLKLLKGIKVFKLSGYKFLHHFFGYLKKNKNISLLSLDPSQKSKKINKNFFFNEIKIKSKHYVCPKYKMKDIVDKKLLGIVERTRPNIILINIGGGIQEILGLYLRNNLKFKPPIICTGAAISFYTHEQAPINKLFDKIYIGWFVRILFNPLVFLPRYFTTIKLFFLVINSKIKSIK
jgi:N-acetylglucosaminyldiphosphoundecaprenol N-acetyl-beta-D-mannosaminyltransferase